jgi:hypothetical protein
VNVAKLVTATRKFNLEREGGAKREKWVGRQAGMQSVGEIERHRNKKTERLRNDKKIPSKAGYPN